jgi:UDP-N-acetylmuramoyl-tripeptide--D-alanyl-D-alanine ligase
MRFSAAQLAAATGGILSGPDVTVDGVGTDTRTLQPGQLYVAVVDRRDGHDYLADAVAAGAPAYLTNGPTVPGATAIVVGDTAAALLDIGRLARAALPDRVVGITGSVGKTTVKDLSAGVLSTTFRTTASPMSYNNEIGVPLTLAGAPGDTEAVVVEMGARGSGHITTLCDVARPTIGVVTRVGPAHTELFGDVAAVAVAKAELVRSLPASGTAIVNADDPHVSAMRHETAAAVITFGVAEPADVSAAGIVLDEVARPTFVLSAAGGSVEVRLSLHGIHQVHNALAAAAVGMAAGIPLDAIAAGLASVDPPRWRMSVWTSSRGVVVVNDAYNANPTSMGAALESLAVVEGRRKVAVLGAMEELGEESPAHHRSVAESAEVLGIEVVAYRTSSYGLPAVTSDEELLARLAPLGPGDVILVKGSRAAGLELVVEALHAALGA